MSIARRAVIIAASVTCLLSVTAHAQDVVKIGATAMITEKSPYIVRASFSVPQSVEPIADWTVQNGVKSVVTIVSDFAPAHDVETYFKQRLEAAGGKVPSRRTASSTTSSSRRSRTSSTPAR